VSLDWLLLALRVVAVVLLYGFLAVVVYTIWTDLRMADSETSRDAAARPSERYPLAWLRDVTGEEDSPSSSHSFAVFPPATLGRTDDNQVVLADECVSACHARIDRRDGEWWLTDLDSRNGTQLNDLPVSKPVPLANGDLIGIGRAQLRFETTTNGPQSGESS
jgi:hypothetical protein